MVGESHVAPLVTGSYIYADEDAGHVVQFRTVTAGTRHTQLPPLVRQTVDAFADGLRRRFGARLVAVRLFGSYARGEAHEDSDVDCLVLIDRLEPGEDRFVTDLAADLIWQIGGIVVSPLVMSPSQFERWKGTERQTPLSIAREGIDV